MNWPAYISIAVGLILPTVLFMSGVMLVKAPTAFAKKSKLSNESRGKLLMVVGGAALIAGLIALYLHQHATYLLQQSILKH
jgi:uncharacterized protein YjeT (DUF2065 family)